MRFTWYLLSSQVTKESLFRIDKMELGAAILRQQHGNAGQHLACSGDFPTANRQHPAPCAADIFQGRVARRNGAIGALIGWAVLTERNSAE